MKRQGRTPADVHRVGEDEEIYPLSYNRFYPETPELDTPIHKDLNRLNDFMRWLDSVLGTEEEATLLKENPWLEEFKIDIPETRYEPREKPGDITEVRLLHNKLRFIGLLDLRGKVNG